MKSFLGGKFCCLYVSTILGALFISSIINSVLNFRKDANIPRAKMMKPSKIEMEGGIYSIKVAVDSLEYKRLEMLINPAIIKITPTM